MNKPTLKLKPKTPAIAQPPAEPPTPKKTAHQRKQNARQRDMAELHAKVAAIAGLPVKRIRQPPEKIAYRRDLAWCCIHLERISASAPQHGLDQQSWFPAFTQAKAALQEALDLLEPLPNTA